jgi:hypothetical protein
MRKRKSQTKTPTNHILNLLSTSLVSLASDIYPALFILLPVLYQALYLIHQSFYPSFHPSFQSTVKMKKIKIDRTHSVQRGLNVVSPGILRIPFIVRCPRDEILRRIAPTWGNMSKPR